MWCVQGQNCYRYATPDGVFWGNKERKTRNKRTAKIFNLIVFLQPLRQTVIAGNNFPE